MTITLEATGDLVVTPAPSRDLDAAIGANVDALCELLAPSPPYVPGPCAVVAGCDADGFGWALPDGLLPIVDAERRFRGWQLDQA